MNQELGTSHLNFFLMLLSSVFRTLAFTEARTLLGGLEPVTLSQPHKIVTRIKGGGVRQGQSAYSEVMKVHEQRGKECIGRGGS